MKDLIIIGAGDFGRETIWVAERMNAVTPTWNILGFVDDGKTGEIVDGYPVLGDVDWLYDYPREVCFCCAISSGKIKQMIWEKLEHCTNIHPVTLIDPSAVIGRTCCIDEGSVICAGSVLTVAIHVARGCIINLNCTIGHDTILEEYCTIHPGSNISGKVIVGERATIGAGAIVNPGIRIAPDTVLGAGAVVIKSIEESGIYVGVPTRKAR